MGVSSSYRNADAVLITGVVLAYLGSSSLAAPASMVEKMISTEAGSKVEASSTIILAISCGSSSGHHQREEPLASLIASIYFFSAERSEATRDANGSSRWW